MKNLILSFTVMCCASVLALDFPGANPGMAKVSGGAMAKEYTLSNNVISVTWSVAGGKLLLTQIENKISGGKYPQERSPVFILSDKKEGTPISNWVITGVPETGDIKPLSKSSSRGKHFGGKSVTVFLKNSKSGLVVKWIGELRDGANYVRSIIYIKGTKPLSLKYISLNCDIDASNPVQVGAGRRGMPAVSGQMFFGIEVPFFKNTLKNNQISQGFNCNLPVKQGVTTSFAAVIGVYPPRQLRRAFLCYIERERARSYSPFLHYNCWFDLERKVSEVGMLNRINAINAELSEKRGVKIDSYVVDDGYDDYRKGFWVFNAQKFPNGFKPLAKRLAEIDSHLGLWLSPAGGYAGSRERIKRAKEIGINSLNLATPVYYKWFLDRHMSFVKEEQVNYFKWDKLGGGVSGHFMALMDIASKLRQVNPQLFINTTVGTWQSPFWLNHVDCTWRGGQDMGFSGVGDEREKWLTYRDGISYQRIKGSAYIYPLNALMNHGIVFANGHKFSKRALKGGRDLRHETRSYFGGGYALQELYITPGILEDEQWDAIADAAKWARKNVSTLVDSHFTGGDPMKLEVYGFASWNRNRGTLVLRNPSDKPQVYELDIAEAFELPLNAAQHYRLTSPYGDQALQTLKVKAGVKQKIDLAPFDVLVFDAVAF